MRLLKILFYFFLTLAILFALAWTAVTFYKKEIIAEINSQLAEVVNGTVHIHDADLAIWATFPNTSLRLEDVSLRGLSSPEDIFRCERIYVAVKLFPLLKGEVHLRSLQVQRARLFMYRSASGELNVKDLVRKKEDKASGGADFVHWEGAEFEFKQVETIYHDSLRQKFFALRLEDVKDRITRADSAVHQRLTGRVIFEGLTFNAGRGAFLKNADAKVDFHLRYLPQSRQLFLDTSSLRLPKSELRLVGSVHSRDSGYVRLHIESDKLDYREGLSVLPPPTAKTLQVVSIQHPFAYAIDIVAPLGVAANPSLEMQFKLKKNEVYSRKIHLRNLSLAGTFTNQSDKNQPFSDQNTRISLVDIEGEMDGIPFTGDAQLSDLRELALQLHSVHRFDLSRLNHLLDESKLKFNAGSFVSEFTYAGKLSEYLDTALVKFNGELAGEVKVEGADVTWVPRKLTFQKINCRVQFSEDSVRIHQFSVESGKNQLRASGIMVNYVPFFLQPTQKSFVKLNLQSPSLDLSTLLVKKQKKKKSTGRQKQEDRRKISDMMDEIFSNLEFQISLQVDRLKSGSFQASKMNGQLKLGKNQLEASKMKMNFGGGTLSASFLMKDLDRAINPMYLTAATSNVSIRQLFSAFNNFNQKDIQDKNLEGTISASAKLGVKVDDNFEVVTGSFWGPVQVTIRNGAINNLPAFDKLSSFLLKRRDFDHVRFAQIDSKIYIKGKEIEIERMEVQSNVLGLFLEGVYSLRNKTDLSIQIPLSNLRRRDQKFAPERVGVHGKAGPSVFLKARPDEKGEMTLSYDLFHKFKKKK